MEDPLGRWLIEVLLLVVCAFLTACQAALTGSVESKIEETYENDSRAKKMLALMERADQVTLALRALRNLLITLFTSLAVLFFLPYPLDDTLTAVCVSLGMLLIYPVCCRLVPERVAKRHAERSFMRLLPIIRLVDLVMRPFVLVERFIAGLILRLFGIDPNAPDEEVTQEEIRAMVDIGEESGVIESEERDMIENVFEFGNLTAADCMTHRTDVTAIWIGEEDEVILQTIRDTGLSRFPVYNEDIDDVVGILATRDYLMNAREKNPKKIGKLLRDPYFVPETVPTDVLFRNMQRAKTHIAIVVDEYGGMSGLVTMEDLLEEIVGNIYDEFDPANETEIEKISDDEWRVSGATLLETIADELDITLPEDEDYDTLGGLIFSHFHVIPQDGSTPKLTVWCTDDGEEPDDDEPTDRLEITVEKILDRRVETALIKLVKPEKKEKKRERQAEEEKPDESEKQEQD